MDSKHNVRLCRRPPQDFFWEEITAVFRGYRKRFGKREILFEGYMVEELASITTPSF